MNWIDQIAGLFSAVAGALGLGGGGVLVLYLTLGMHMPQPAIFLALRARIYPDELEKETDPLEKRHSHGTRRAGRSRPGHLAGRNDQRRMARKTIWRLSTDRRVD